MHPGGKPLEIALRHPPEEGYPREEGRDGGVRRHLGVLLRTLEGI